MVGEQMQTEPVTLQRFLDGEHREIRERVRERIARPQFRPPAETPPLEQYRELVFEWVRELARGGEAALGFPAEFGGQDDVGGSIAAFETLALGDLSMLVKCGVQFGLFGGAVLHLGTRPHHERYLREIGTLGLPGCFAMTETGHGSNVQAIETTATYDPEAREFVVDTPHESARKDYIGNAARHGRMAAVFAQLIVGGEQHGVHCLLVPIRDRDGSVVPGVGIEDCGEKLGLNGVDNGRVWFDQVRVPREALLDRYAQVSPDGTYSSSIESRNRRFFTMLGTLIQGRVSICGAAISATKCAQTIAVRYANRRRQFEVPGSTEEVLLLDYRAHQRRLLPALATTYAFHFAQDALVAELHRVFSDADVSERERRQLETMAAGLKALATWHATATIQTCREACGGAGYLSVNRLAALKADTDVFTTFEGDNTVLLQLVAKSLLTGYKDQFEDRNAIDMVGFVAGQVYETVIERSAVREIVQRLTDDLVPGREDDHDLLDRDYHFGLFRWREAHMLSGVARRLKRGIDAGEDAFDVFNGCQDHMIATARAAVHVQVLEAFTAALERCGDDGLRALLERVCDLYALANIEADRAWFQEHGRMSSTRAKAVTRTLNRLCTELRDSAEVLVDAFGIPDSVLAAPIGVRDASASVAPATRA
jgi:acyl-CoA oxidase